MLKIILLLMRLFGLGVIKFDLTVCSNYVVIYNVLIVVMHFITALLSIFLENLTVHYSQNSLTISGFWLQYFGRILIASAISIAVLKQKYDLEEIHDEINTLCDKCKKYRKEVPVSKLQTLQSLLILIGSLPISPAYDIIHRQGANIFTLWSAYIPGIVLNIFLTYVIFLTRSVSALFKAVNDYLAEFNSERKLNNELLQDIFATHKRIFGLLMKLERIYKYPYLQFVLLALHGVILFTYTTILDLIRIKTKQPFIVRDHYFTEYWTLTYIQEIFALILAAHELKENANVCSEILHKVRSRHNDLNEHASVYSFYLMHTEVDVNAAGFMDIDYGMFFAILGATIKYVFILLQFDRGADEFIN